MDEKKWEISIEKFCCKKTPRKIFDPYKHHLQNITWISNNASTFGPNDNLLYMQLSRSLNSKLRRLQI